MPGLEPLWMTRGRRYGSEYSYVDLPNSNPFSSDNTRLGDSKATRRLMDKTQVFCDPENSNIRNRATHTGEVYGVATSIADQLDLNIELCRAIAKGHDIGHTPYGHEGEQLLSELGGKPFKHNVFSIVVAQHIERQGWGLNLSYETLEGILHHARGDHELTVDPNLPAEYNAVMFADKIAYTFADLNDALRSGYLKKEPDVARALGKVQRDRQLTVINALLAESRAKGYVDFKEGPVFQRFNELRQFMKDEVYHKMNWDLQKAALSQVYDFFKNDPDFEGVDPVVAVALLTDRDVNTLATHLLHGRLLKTEDIHNFGMYEIWPHIKGREIDYTNPDLDWGKERTPVPLGKN
jgi:dGTPase